jgi:hypothetical protein
VSYEYISLTWSPNVPPPCFICGFPFTNIGDGCSIASKAMLAFTDSVLLVRLSLGDSEHTASLLSVDDEVIRSARDFDRFFRLVSPKLFLCCGTFAGVGLAVELTAFPL